MIIAFLDEIADAHRPDFVFAPERGKRQRGCRVSRRFGCHVVNDESNFHSAREVSKSGTGGKDFTQRTQRNGTKDTKNTKRTKKM